MHRLPLTSATAGLVLLTGFACAGPCPPGQGLCCARRCWAALAACHPAGCPQRWRRPPQALLLQAAVLPCSCRVSTTLAASGSLTAVVGCTWHAAIWPQLQSEWRSGAPCCCRGSGTSWSARRVCPRPASSPGTAAGTSGLVQLVSRFASLPCCSAQGKGASSALRALCMLGSTQAASAQAAGLSLPTPLAQGHLVALELHKSHLEADLAARMQGRGTCPAPP